MMKWLLRIVCVVIVCMFLTGCFAYNKLTTLRVKGGMIKVPFGSVAPVEGEDMQATLTREVHLGIGNNTKDVPMLSDINMQEESAEAGKFEIKK